MDRCRLIPAFFALFSTLRAFGLGLAVTCSGTREADDTTPTYKYSALAAYWDLDETSGTRYDSEGSSDLTDYGTVTYRAGKISNAAEFDDANAEYLERSDNAALSPTVSVAVSVWVYLDDITPPVGTTYAIMQKGSSYLLRFNASYDRMDFVVVQSDTFAKTASSATSSVSAGTWYHVVGIASAGMTYLYLDNVEYTGEAYDNTIQDTAETFAVGKYAGGGGLIDGAIDELGVWGEITFGDSADRQKFVDSLYNSGNGVDYATISGSP